MLGINLSVFCTMILSTVAAAAAAAASPPAATDWAEWTPWDGKSGQTPRHGCLTDQDAQAVVKTIVSLAQKMDASLANAAVAPDFHGYSYSIVRPGCQGIPVS